MKNVTNISKFVWRYDVSHYGQKQKKKTKNKCEQYIHNFKFYGHKMKLK